MGKCCRTALVATGVILVTGAVVVLTMQRPPLYDATELFMKEFVSSWGFFNESDVTGRAETTVTNQSVASSPRHSDPPGLDRADFSRLRAGRPPPPRFEAPLIITPVPDVRLNDEPWIHDTAELLHAALHERNVGASAACVLGIDSGIPLRIIYCEENSTSPFRAKGELPLHSPFEQGYLVMNPVIEDHGAAFEEVQESAMTCSGVVRARIPIFATVTVKNTEMRGSLAKAVQVRVF